MEIPSRDDPKSTYGKFRISDDCEVRHPARDTALKIAVAFCAQLWGGQKCHISHYMASKFLHLLSGSKDLLHQQSQREIIVSICNPQDSLLLPLKSSSHLFEINVLPDFLKCL